MKLLPPAFCLAEELEGGQSLQALGKVSRQLPVCLPCSSTHLPLLQIGEYQQGKGDQGDKSHKHQGGDQVYIDGKAQKEENGHNQTESHIRNIKPHVGLKRLHSIQDRGGQGACVAHLDERGTQIEKMLIDPLSDAALDHGGGTLGGDIYGGLGNGSQAYGRQHA
jgi:hypothetical protein